TFCPPPPILDENNQPTKSLTPKILIKNHHIESSANIAHIFLQLKQASCDYQKVRFTYKGKDREANPYALTHHNGVWYLLAEEKGILKYFTLSKISCLKVLQGFKPSKKIIDEINQSLTAWISQNPILVRLCISNAAREYIFRKNFLIKYKIIEESPTDFIVECYFGYVGEVLNLVKCFLPYIRILSPKSLQEQLECELKSYLNLQDSMG
ncbi:WYL domain-containing protein, partial [Helicobacter rodentium]